MSTLQERLDRIKAGFVEQAPESALAIMHAATEGIRASGIMDRIPTVGDPLPAFALSDTDGQTVNSTDLLARGPLVITHYRGDW